MFLNVDARPTMSQLISMKKEDGQYLRVIDWIASSSTVLCIGFANLLLDDDRVAVRALRRQNNDIDALVRQVLSLWLSIDDDDPNDTAVPRTWGALANCVEEAGLDGALAKAIKDIHSPSHQGMTGLPSVHCVFLESRITTFCSLIGCTYFSIGHQHVVSYL